jgi:transcriptional regulator with XRE-family HTH domain
MKLTLRELSEMTGLSIQTIHYIERRKQAGTVANYQKLAIALGVDITELIDKPEATSCDA